MQAFLAYPLEKKETSIWDNVFLSSPLFFYHSGMSKSDTYFGEILLTLGIARKKSLPIMSYTGMSDFHHTIARQKINAHLSTFVLNLTNLSVSGKTLKREDIN